MTIASEMAKIGRVMKKPAGGDRLAGLEPLGDAPHPAVDRSGGHPAVGDRTVLGNDPYRGEVLRLRNAPLRHDDVRKHRADVGLHTGELPGFEAPVGIGEGHDKDDGPRRTGDVAPRVAVASRQGIARSVGQRQADIRQQPPVVGQRRAVASDPQILRHRDGHIDRHRIGVRHRGQHVELRARSDIVAHVRLGMRGDAVDRRAQLRIADVERRIAQRLLGRAHRSLGRAVLCRILVELRLADGIDPRQRHGPFVVVTGFDGLCARRFELGLGRQHRGRELLGVDAEEQLPAPHGHAARKVARGEEPVHAGLDHGIEIARKVTDEAHAVRHAVDSGTECFDL